MIFEKYDRIVFAGDSVTDADCPKPIGDGFPHDLGKGYVSVINNLLGACYPELSIRVTNSGHGGNSSRDLFNRFDKDVVSLNPDWLAICIGINDVWREFDVPFVKEWYVGLEEYEQNVEKMILAVKNNVKGIFMLTPYIIEPNRNDLMRKRMDEYTEVCKKLAKKYSCKLVDFQAMFEKYCEYHHPCYLAWDRIHPNSVGATLMAKEFLKACDFDFNKTL